MATNSRPDSSRLYKVCDKLPWPRAITYNTEAKGRIIHGVCKGMEKIDGLFGDYDYTHARSTVHGDDEECTQACALCVASWRSEHRHEIPRKARTTALSHRLDDLTDGEHALDVLRSLRTCRDFGLGMKAYDTKAYDSRDVFQCVYRYLIDEHMDKKAYRKVTNEINHAARRKCNQEFIYWGLNRVGIGGILFNPAVKEDDRENVLEVHNEMLVRMVLEETAWERRFHGVLDRIQSNRAGNLLLGLTTKTVQEFAISIESGPFYFPLSLAHSLIYVPPIFLCNAREEVAAGEMVELPEFRDNLDQIIGWLEEIRMLCEEACDVDDRCEERGWQREMVYNCLEHRLPDFARENLRHIYLPS